MRPCEGGRGQVTVKEERRVGKCEGGSYKDGVKRGGK